MPWLVLAIVAVVVFFAWRSAEIFCVSVRDGRALVTRRRVPPALLLFPTSKLRAASPVARPTLGQVLGIAWLAWILDRGRDI